MTSETEIPVALFDLDNTLFDRAGTFRRWADQFVAQRGLDQDQVEWFVAADKDGYAPKHQFWTEARERYGLADSLESLRAAYSAANYELIEPDPLVHAALAALRGAGWRIGVVTNGTMPQQADKAARLGLLPLVDGFCASDEIGIEKPDPRIFEETVRRCGVTPHPAEVQPRWMVGDAPTRDVHGGRSFGLRTIWIHRERSWDQEHGLAPDHTVASVPEAVARILDSGT
jgi:HAD superfamily hydrolase (TIGR01549 family)